MTECLKTYILQFLYKDGNGWAIVNARTPLQAENIFKIQTKFPKPKVTSIKESKWYGENMQLVYEGTTITGNLSPYDLAVMEGYVGSLKDWLKTLKGKKGDKGDKGDTFTYEDLTPEQLDEIGTHVPLTDYYSKEEADNKFSSFIVNAFFQGDDLIPDKTYNEALEALLSGKEVVLHWLEEEGGDVIQTCNLSLFFYGSLLVGELKYMEYSDLFLVWDPNKPTKIAVLEYDYQQQLTPTHGITISSDGNISTKSLLITLTPNSNNTLTPSVSYAAALEALQHGVSTWFSYNNTLLPITGYTDSIIKASSLDGDTKMELTWEASNNYVTASFQDLQPLLTAGTNISIVGNVISATGSGHELTDNEINTICV